MTVWTYVGQIVNFLIFVVVLYYLLYRPVGRIMKARRDKMEEERRDAEKMRAEAQAARADAERMLGELEEKRDRILAEAREKAEATRKELLDLAEEQARDRLDRFRRIMEQERDDLLAKVTDDLRDTIVAVAGSVVGDLSDTLTERGIDRVGELLDGMSAKEVAGAAKSLAEAGGNVRVRSAAPLDAKAVSRLREGLAGKLAVPEIELTFEEDPGLIAGVEVIVGHVDLSAHWRGVIDEALSKQALV
ncbi:MAG: F0F1 ATP synthase subunit delta [Planctomycetota bacterium]